MNHIIIFVVAAIVVLASNLLVTTPVVHAQNGTTPSVRLNALLKIDNHTSNPISGYFRYNIQPPAKFDFSPSNSCEFQISK